MFDREPLPLPPGLDEAPCGPVLDALVGTVDLEATSGYDRVELLRALQRQVSHLQARLYQAMASVADHMEAVEFPDDPSLAWEAAATEIRAALRLTRRAAETELDLAVGLRRRLPRVGNALLRGGIDGARARVLMEGTAHLDEAAARRVVDAVIDDAATLTTGQLAARLRALCIEADPETARERYRQAVERRRVIVEASPDGTAHLLGLDLPPDRVAEVSRRIDRIARSLTTAGETRSLDQIRADVYLDLLAGLHPDAKGGTVELRVDLATLSELTEAPGELGGYGPVIADIARQLAATSRGRWRWVATHPGTGMPIADGTTRRRPTASQRRRVEARDRTCIFPGCRTPANRCHLDHRIPWSHTHHTTTRELDPLCTHDHITVRHHLRWTHQPLPDGDHLWISPLGHTYTTSGRPP